MLDFTEKNYEQSLATQNTFSNDSALIRALEVFWNPTEQLYIHDTTFPCELKRR